METPEEFMMRLASMYARGSGQRIGVPAVEARDNAVRLALLDELEARAAARITHPMREQIANLRLKYTPPRGKL